MSRKRRFAGLGLGLALVAFAVALFGQEKLPEAAKLTADRINIARQALEVIERRKNDGIATKPETVHRWSRRLLEAQRAQHDARAAQIEALEAHLQRMREIEDRAKAAHLAGQLSLLDYLDAQAYRQEAQALLIEFEAR